MELTLEEWEELIELKRGHDLKLNFTDLWTAWGLSYPLCPTNIFLHCIFSEWLEFFEPDCN